MPDKPPAEAKAYGLRLSLGGAPSCAHTVAGLDGWYWTDAPTPVGGPGEVSLERARKADRDPGCPVQLVTMTRSEAVKRRKQIDSWRSHARSGIRALKPETASEAERKRAEQRATVTPKEV